MKEKKKPQLSATQLILLGFLSAILIGSCLLMLPCATASGQSPSYLDALFTASTSVCVTGLTVVDTFSYWSLFGKIVILVLIQLGGLGIISFTTGIMILIGRRVTLKNRLLLESAFNLDTLSGLLGFLGKVFLGTLIVEFVGAVLCLPVFVADYGARGIWIAVFHSISAFCNAGIDIIGPNSLVPYATDLWLNLVTIVLIVIGGIGFVVWWDVIRVTRDLKNRRIHRRMYFRSFSLHTKITLVTTLVLIAGGWVMYLLLEWTNPETLGRFGTGGKLIAALFQSVTTRTAGFASIPQGKLRSSSVIVSVVLMFIGGSSVGTAGGVKTSTIALVFLAAAAVVQGRERVNAFHRTIPSRLVQRASAIVIISLATLLICTGLLTVLQPGEFSDLLFETTSALSTAGLSRGVCADLTGGAKLLLSLCMYFGRVGPISLAIAFAHRSGGDRLRYPEQNITIG